MHAEPMSPAELQPGSVYFAVQFVDDDMLIPTLEPIVFLGGDLNSDDADQLYFQDAESHRRGIQSEDDVSEGGVFYRQREGEMNHDSRDERALDVLMR